MQQTRRKKTPLKWDSSERAHKKKKNKTKQTNPTDWSLNTESEFSRLGLEGIIPSPAFLLSRRWEERTPWRSERRTRSVHIWMKEVKLCSLFSHRVNNRKQNWVSQRISRTFQHKTVRPWYFPSALLPPVPFLRQEVYTEVYPLHILIPFICKIGTKLRGVSGGSNSGRAKLKTGNKSLLYRRRFRFTQNEISIYIYLYISVN